VISRIKAGLLQRWFGLDAQRTAIGINAFLASLLVFFATFQAQYFGVVLVASGWLAASLASSTFRSSAAGIALLSLGFVFILTKTTTGIDDSFMRGNFLMGIVAGAAAVAWTGIAKDATRVRWGMMYVLPLLIVTLLVMMGVANENFGGIPAYIGALLGASLGLLIANNEQHTVPFQALLIGLSAFVLTQFAPRTGKETTSRIQKTETAAAEETEEPDVLDVAAIPADPKLAGNWKSVAKGSKVDFQLGPEGGVTKGAIEVFDVRLNMNAAGEPEQLTVVLPTAKVTTFNPMRDKSVLGAGYLNAASFPKMSYRSTAIKKDGDKYVVSGEFEMLGKKAAQQIELKFAATGSDKGKDYLVMVGKGAVDRTKFGMASDAKIGDIVTVTFEIELRK
jgi:polyisoprenoid-binding protein YceI